MGILEAVQQCEEDPCFFVVENFSFTKPSVFFRSDIFSSFSDFTIFLGSMVVVQPFPLTAETFFVLYNHNESNSKRWGWKLTGGSCLFICLLFFDERDAEAETEERKGIVEASDKDKYLQCAVV